MSDLTPNDLARVEAALAALASENRAMAKQLEELVTAWNTARGVVRFMKFLGAMATAITAIWALIQMGSHK